MSLMPNLLPPREQLRPGQVLDRVLPERPELPRMPEHVIEESVTDMVPVPVEPEAAVDLPEMTPRPDVTGKPQGDQVRGRATPPPVPDLPGAISSDGYLRLRVEVKSGRATVTTANVVDGPLVTAEAATGGYLWEVTVDGQILASDALGDLSTRRSFADPGAGRDDPRRGHHVTELTAFEFTVRVPLERLPAEALGRAQIGLYRVKDASRPLPLRSARRSLAEDFARDVREVARVASLDDAVIGRELGERIRGMLRR